MPDRPQHPALGAELRKIVLVTVLDIPPLGRETEVLGRRSDAPRASEKAQQMTTTGGPRPDAAHGLPSHSSPGGLHLARAVGADAAGDRHRVGHDRWPAHGVAHGNGDVIATRAISRQQIRKAQGGRW